MMRAETIGLDPSAGIPAFQAKRSETGRLLDQRMKAFNALIPASGTASVDGPTLARAMQLEGARYEEFIEAFSSASASSDGSYTIALKHPVTTKEQGMSIRYETLMTGTIETDRVTIDVGISTKVPFVGWVAAKVTLERHDNEVWSIGEALGRRRVKRYPI